MAGEQLAVSFLFFLVARQVLAELAEGGDQGGAFSEEFEVVDEALDETVGREGDAAGIGDVASPGRQGVGTAVCGEADFLVVCMPDALDVEQAPAVGSEEGREEQAAAPQSPTHHVGHCRGGIGGVVHGSLEGTAGAGMAEAISRTLPWGVATSPSLRSRTAFRSTASLSPLL